MTRRLWTGPLRPRPTMTTEPPEGAPIRLPTHTPTLPTR
jgi:hypothetical protein